MDKIAPNGESCEILFCLLRSHVAYELYIGGSLPHWNVSFYDGFHGSNSFHEQSKLVCHTVLPGALSGGSGDEVFIFHAEPLVGINDTEHEISFVKQGGKCICMH